MSKITRIEQRTEAIRSEFSALSSVNLHAAPRRHRAWWVLWGIGIILLAGIIAGALWFGTVKDGILMTPTGLYGIAVISFLLIVLLLIFRPK